MSLSNKRAFFENYAMQRGLDPLKASSWTFVTKSQIVNETVLILNNALLFTLTYSILGRG